MNGRTAKKIHREARLAAFTILSEIQHEPFWKVRLPMAFRLLFPKGEGFFNAKTRYRRNRRKP